MTTEPSRETKVVPPFAIGSRTWPGVAKIIEETAELGQVAGKLMAYPDAPHPDGSDLRERLIEEMGDAFAALTYCASANGLTAEVRERARRKLGRFNTWHDEEADRGQ